MMTTLTLSGQHFSTQGRVFDRCGRVWVKFQAHDPRFKYTLEFVTPCPAKKVLAGSAVATGRVSDVARLGEIFTNKIAQVHLDSLKF